MTYPFETEIRKAAEKHNLDSALVAAIASVESSFRPEASRYEAKFQKKYVDPHPGYSRLDTETRALLSSSMGLLQVMGVVAHEDGLPLACLEDLYKPEVGLEYGCKQLEQLFQRYWQSDPGTVMENVISAYNIGTARKGTGGKYTNQVYVDKVLAKFREYIRVV